MKQLVTALLCLTFASFIFVGCGNDDPTNYTITATAGENGTITPSGNVTVEEKGTQQFTITANSGYEIDRVLIDGVNNISAVNSGNYTFTNVIANHTIAVTFKATIGSYTITASAGDNGTITPNGAISVDENGSQLFTITPNSGYEINQILIDGTNNTEAVSTGSYTFTDVTADHTITASFKALPVIWDNIVAGDILYFGNYFNDNSSDMYLILETDAVRYDEDEDWFVGEGNFIFFEIISGPSGLVSGTYTYADADQYTSDDDVVPGTFFWSWYMIGANTASEKDVDITDGTVIINVNGSNYEITFTFTDANGVEHTGSYTGTLTFYDFS